MYSCVGLFIRTLSMHQSLYMALIRSNKDVDSVFSTYSLSDGATKSSSSGNLSLVVLECVFLGVDVAYDTESVSADN